MHLDISTVDRFVGAYSITDARTPAAQAYVGTMVLARHGRFLHATAMLDANQTRHGIAIPFSDRLVLAFGPKDKVEIGVYSKAGQDLHGLWVPPGATSDDLKGCGREPGALQPDGSYKIDRAIAIDGSEYAGSLSITPRRTDAWPRPVDLAWTLADGVYRSFGLDYRQALYTTFSFEPDQPHGLIVYDMADDGSLAGTVVTNSDTTLGYERLQRNA